MLASTPYISSANNTFLPTIPSPLSPRSANIHGGRRCFMASHEQAEKQSQNPDSDKEKKAEVPFARRSIKKAPSPRQDELKERRRGMFLKKVREGREERRFDSRGEDVCIFAYLLLGMHGGVADEMQIMRLDFMQRQRQWEAERACEAPSMFSFANLPDEDEVNEIENQYDLPMSSADATRISAPSTQPMLVLPDEEVDDVLQRENEELEALLGFMPETDGGEGREGCAELEKRSDNLWSDDDDYDALFSDLLDHDGKNGNDGQQARPPVLQQVAHDGDMDLS